MEDMEDVEDWDSVFSRINSSQAKRDPPKPTEAHEYIFGGVTIKFPYAAYPSQEQLMEKVIEGLMSGDNCLLESPTGTGKTAALLCSLLAWHRHCKRDSFSQQYFNKLGLSNGKFGSCTCGFTPEDSTFKTRVEKYKPDGKYSKPKFRVVGSYQTENSPVKRKDCPSPAKVQKLETQRDREDLCQYCQKKYFFLLQPPRIIYATRTHSQIQQVVEQLKNTHYSDSVMTILGSRPVMCINTEQIEKMVRTKKGISYDGADGGSQCSQQPLERHGRIQIDEGCQILKRNYYKNLKIREALFTNNQLVKHKVFSKSRERFSLNNSSSSNQHNKNNSPDIEEMPTCLYYEPPFNNEYREFIENGAWDISEIKTHGQQVGKCPFFGARSILNEVEIVFCPYNYLINPKIRETVELDISTNVLVFDEAHNLEDICRQVVSFTLDMRNLQEQVKEIERVQSTWVDHKKLGAADEITKMLQRLVTWMNQNAPKPLMRDTVEPILPLIFDNATEILSELEKIGLGPEKLCMHTEHLDYLTGKKEDEESVPTSRVPTYVTRQVEQLLLSLDFLYKDDNVHHYAMCLTTIPEIDRPIKTSSTTTAFSISNSSTQYTQQVLNVTLELICLNPAIAFRPLKFNAHSIIVASGTLSPLSSFSGELETPFRVQLSADHVIKANQTLSGYLTRGEFSEFNFIKSQQINPEVQTELGLVILEICKTVEHGVLVFLPSYWFMNTLKKSWSEGSNSIIQRLTVLKHVFFEQSLKSDFEKDMLDYQNLIENPIPDSPQTGCIIFAVMRGKISEGINFSDNQARAVVTVGIPFPHVGSASIICKKKYNNIRAAELQKKRSTEAPALLKGEDWYRTQTFRAISQAFGRCIRHRDDWGVILMIEQRFRYNRYQTNLSNWVKKDGLREFENLGALTLEIAQFIHDRKFNASKKQLSCSSQIPEANNSFVFDITDSITNGSQLTQICSQWSL